MEAMKAPKVLVVDDDEKILFAFQEVLKRDRYKTLLARDGEEALERLATEQPALVFLDITMPRLDGLEALKRIREQNSAVPVVVITGYGTMQTAIRAVQLGAFEYLTKPLDVEKIREVTRRALSTAKPHASELKRVAFKADVVQRYELVGNSPQMQEVYKLIGSISTTPNHTSVLILGESGTGKELVARAIHNNSPNSREPFVPINCTVLPETLLESELFGHEKGAFTGAIERKLGKFEIAGKGSIFLDEIGNLSPYLQQKLLRVLQEREFERLGGNTPLHVDARFIAATNKDLASEVREGNFREDLYFRLNVAVVHLPPLREHKDDIPLLANYFLAKYNEQLNKSVIGFSDKAMELLLSHSYPGNVRQLENLIERAVMLTRGEVILPETVREVLVPETHEPVSFPIISPVYSKSRDHVLGVFEKQFLMAMLRAHKGNVTAAAKASKMTRQNFQRLMKKHRVRSVDFRTG